MTREKIRNRKRIFYLSAVIVALIVVVIYAYRVIAVEMYQSQVEEERNRLLSEKAELEEELKNVQDPKYIEQQARTQLRMIFPGEVLYILPEKTEEKNDNQ